MPDTLKSLAVNVLQTASPYAKADATRAIAKRWSEGGLAVGESVKVPDRPARPAQPELRLPRDMPRRRLGSEEGRIALLHALAHIELNAIDLACDLIARFPTDDGALPVEFYNDWINVADDEARHFKMLERRLQELGSNYGAHPAHDGLWQAAEETKDDLAARLAIVPLILEARGLDVSPATIEKLNTMGDGSSATILDEIYNDEISHVHCGIIWFEWVCDQKQIESVSHWHDLVAKYFKGSLKPPFNLPARNAAGFKPDYYLNHFK
ncbi:unnamed protein product [Symbiodinium microadriaticum]|nr:unnamed protein product [Symbiodinium microadriaticum]